MNELITGENRRSLKLMGCDFEFVIAEESATDEALEHAIAEVRRIEKLLTEFSECSETSLINTHAGIRPIQVSDEMYSLIKRCKEIWKFTQGAFDITSGAVRKLYNFKGHGFELPDASALEEALSRTGSDKIMLGSKNSVYLSQQGMRIGFGAIGKGYAADMAKRKLIRLGIRNAVINASGDLTAFGRRTDGSMWKVGIADPNEPSRIIAWLPVPYGSIATSGDYEQYFESEGVRYSHNIDPKSGKPVTGIKSVTIVSSSAELSDALATAVTVMGVEVGLDFIEQLPGVHALVITDKNKIYTSQHLKLERT
ncbi:MAG: FAD:protein FMN transferase [Chryseolinea sp.]